MSDSVRPSGHQLDPPGVNFPDPSYIGELYEEDDIVYTWTGDRWIVWGGTDGSPGVTKDYVDNNFLSLSGGTMTGPIKGTGEMLHGRAALQLMAGSETPVVINSGSTYRPAFSIFGYKAGESDNRGPVIELKANGDMHLTGQLTADGGVVDSTISRKIEALEARIKELEGRFK